MRCRVFRDYGLSMTLSALFPASWVLQALFTNSVAYNDAVEQGSQFAWKEMWRRVR